MYKLCALLVFAAACGAKTAAPTNKPQSSGSVSEQQGSATAQPGEATGAVCGTRGVPACGPNEFCNYQPGADCGETDKPGHCALRPQQCDERFTPVCGCDGKTYSDPCSAAAAAVGVRAIGQCT